MAKNVSLKINGMHCGSCAKIIEERLLEFEDVESAKASFAKENVEISFNQDKVSIEDIEGALKELGYSVGDAPLPSAKKNSLLEGIVYGLIPHIGCIGFIIASVLGATIAVEFFKPLLMNPWFFHILVLISLGFATLSSAFYLKKNGILSMDGIKRKKKYLATMYGSTIGINLVLFLLVFPMLANIDTGSFADSSATELNLAAGETQAMDSILRLQVNIPCPGHAPLISNELKTIDGVTGVRFEFPNNFDVAFSSETSKDEILALEVFDVYPAVLVSESVPDDSAEEAALLESVSEIREVSAQQSVAGSSCTSCGGTCGGQATTSSCGCGAS